MERKYVLEEKYQTLDFDFGFSALLVIHSFIHSFNVDDGDYDLIGPHLRRKIWFFPLN